MGGFMRLFPFLLFTATLFAEPATLTRILQAEDLRMKGDPIVLKSILAGDERVAKAAIYAAGRMGDPAAVEPLMRVLQGKRKNPKKWAAFALSLISDPTAFLALSQNVALQKDKDVVVAFLRALGNTGNEKALGPVVQAIETRAEPEILEAAFHALGKLWNSDSTHWNVPPELLNRVVLALSSPQGVGATAGFALSRYKGDMKQLDEKLLISVLEKSVLAADTQSFLCRLFSKHPITKLQKWVLKNTQENAPFSVRYECFKALSLLPSNDETKNAILQGMVSKEAAMRIQAIETASAHSLEPSQIEGALLTENSSWVKAYAFKALCRLQTKNCRTKIDALLKGSDILLAQAGVESLGILGESSDVDKIIALLNHANIRIAETAWETLNNVSFDKKIPDALARKDVGILNFAAELIGKKKWNEYLQPLTTLYSQLDSTEFYEAKLSMANAIEILSGKKPAPIAVPIQQTVFTYSEIQEALNSRILFRTTKGEFEVILSEETPLTALHFYRFSKSIKGELPLYNGKTFHRVVPNFVVQGGDPRGDGFGGPGFFIRDEVTPEKHRRSTLGIATAGKDTGGSQFFVNLNTNLHLDGKYTMFGDVIRGMEVVDQLEVGDSIVQAIVVGNSHGIASDSRNNKH